MRGPNIAKSKILIVRGNRAARAGVRKQLREFGVTVIEEAEDGAEAIDKLGYFPADLVICGMRMAPWCGIEFTRRVRTADDSPNPLAPIIMMTADTTEASKAEAMAAGVNDFIAEPVTSAALFERISAILAEPPAGAE